MQGPPQLFTVRSYRAFSELGVELPETTPAQQRTTRLISLLSLVLEVDPEALDLFEIVLDERILCALFCHAYEHQASATIIIGTKVDELQPVIGMRSWLDAEQALKRQSLIISPFVRRFKTVCGLLLPAFLNICL